MAFANVFNRYYETVCRCTCPPNALIGYFCYTKSHKL